VLPELARDLDRLDTGGLPPCSLVAGTMDRAVMGAAQRDSELVAGPAAERAWLGVPKMMRVRWLAAAYEASLLSNVAQMLPVAIPTRCSNCEDALINASGLITSGIGSLRLHLWRDL
jgi:hypothetical protein